MVQAQDVLVAVLGPGMWIPDSSSASVHYVQYHLHVMMHCVLFLRVSSKP